MKRDKDAGEDEILAQIERYSKVIIYFRYLSLGPLSKQWNNSTIILINKKDDQNIWIITDL